MTKEELLKPRWEVIANYPWNTEHEIGDIISEGKYHIEPDDWSISLSTNELQYAIGIFPSEYPAIFKKLEWWEKREDKDLPKYVSLYGDNIEVTSYNIKTGQFWFDIKENGEEFNVSLPLRGTTPSTEEDYLNQQG